MECSAKIREEMRFLYGKVAKQAGAAVLISYADNVALVTVCSGKEREGVDFLPLLVDYQERAYAAGKIPGGFIKREGKPSEKEIVSARMIDRCIRPLIPKSIRWDIQIIAHILSADQVHPVDILGINGASCALMLSEVMFDGPIGAVRVGMKKGEFLINPTYQELGESLIDLVIAASEKKIMMIELGAKEVEEKVIEDAIEFSFPYIREIIRAQRELCKEHQKPKKAPPSFEIFQELFDVVKGNYGERIKEALYKKEKREREEAMNAILEDAKQALLPIFPEKEKQIEETIEEIARSIFRERVLNEGIRPDGRGLLQIRNIECEVSVLPRTHGSSLFTRGQTQALVVVTLGTAMDEQIIDALEGRTTKRFMLHYNFPPFSTGEVKPLHAPERREIGHGALAERALLPLIPDEETFPYTIRVVSDILESNGSTSMATVSGASLALMDAGVPISASCAGISIGLVEEGERFATLVDITGIEDRFGDMDFKVAGTRKGITAIQLDLKIKGITQEILSKALKDAKKAREEILNIMELTISKPREKLSPFAPRVTLLFIPAAKIRDLIGPSGRTIKNIIDTTGVKIDISDDGRVKIYSVDEEAAQAAVEMIRYLTEDVEVGKIYLGKVTRIAKFGAFVEIIPGKEGLLHISEIAEHPVRRVEDILSEGDEVLVKVTNIDELGRFSLSRKLALRQMQEKEKMKDKR